MGISDGSRSGAGRLRASIVRLVGALRGAPAVCGCGHAREAHEHYRRGTDCSLCSCARLHRS